MGNTPSCVPLSPVAGSSSSSSSSTASCKVIHADGTVTRLARPVRASELMLDHPGQFVCDSCRLAVGCRVPGVAADELLQPRRAYFLLPMDMLYSVLTDEEMAALSAGSSHAAATSWKRITTAARSHRNGRRRSRPRDSSGDGASRVFPVLGLQLHADHGVEAQAGHAEAAGTKSSGGTGLRRYRSWQPALDTIEELS